MEKPTLEKIYKCNQCLNAKIELCFEINIGIILITAISGRTPLEYILAGSL